MRRSKGVRKAETYVPDWLRRGPPQMVLETGTVEPQPMSIGARRPEPMVDAPQHWHENAAWMTDLIRKAVHIELDKMRRISFDSYDGVGRLTGNGTGHAAIVDLDGEFPGRAQARIDE
jgi:hypothetical protein